MYRKSIRYLMLCAVFAVIPAAAEESTTPVSSWNGEAELGLITTRGNTSTSSLNAKITVQNKRNQWEHRFKAETLRTSDALGTIASNDMALVNSRYNWTDRKYVFGEIRYEADRFAGFAQRVTESLGYGYKFINTESLTLDGEAGLGAQQTELTDGSRSSKAIVRLGATLGYKLSPTSSLKETLLVEDSDINTYTELVTELKVKINSALAMKLGLTVKDNSNVPPDKHHTDTQSAVTLVYDF